MGLLLTGGAQRLHAQVTAPASAAIAAGWSTTAGLIGVEYVRRPAIGGAPVGWAVGVGAAGAGARVNVAIGRPSDARRIPYLAVGAVALPWLDFFDARGAASVEGGVQFWPVRGGHLYLDLGGGAAIVAERSGGSHIGPVLRALAGRAF